MKAVVVREVHTSVTDRAWADVRSASLVRGKLALFSAKVCSGSSSRAANLLPTGMPTLQMSNKFAQL